MDTQKEIGELVRELEENFLSGDTQQSEYVSFNLKDNINRVDAYINSKHISGDTDSLGRDKPFFNITTSAVNVWYRATDIDRKDIKVKPSKIKDTVKALIASKQLEKEMEKMSFGQFLNKWGRGLARDGSVVVKFVEKDGQLHANVISWQSLIIDPIDFDNNPVIEILQLTPAQLRREKAYDQEIVSNLIKTVKSRETNTGNSQNTSENYIKLYEIHGELPLSYITGKEKDDEEYTQQMHVISFVEGKGGEYEDFTLVKGREKEHPYMITHLIEEDGRSKSIGAVEHLFEAQWMQNHTAKQIKDHLDLASKMIYQTADPNFVGQNVLEEIQSGDILTHAPNKPLNQLNNSSHDIGTLQSFGEQWKALGNEITGISEAMLGETPKSGTAWRQTEAILRESHSLFEVMTENKGLHIIDMMHRFILPYIKKKLINNHEEILATLKDNEIEVIDARYISVEADKRAKEDIKDALLKGEVPLEVGTEKYAGDIKQELSKLGNRRSFVPDDITNLDWNEYFKDMEWEIEVDVTGEAKDTQANLTTLTTVLQTIAGNPMILQDKNAKLLFNKILNMTGAVSPLELSETTPVPQQTNPQQMQIPIPQNTP